MQERDFDLDPGQWATLRRLLDEALEREPAQRAAWLETLDGPLAEFKPRLRELLEHAAGTSHERMGTLPKVETADFAPPPHVAMPERIGPYRLLRELGSGGMASVWLAQRSDMLQGRQVALKLPHGDWVAYGVRGASRRTGLAERMKREREILATLNHPNIASLFDAGVADDGQPYLALEYVEGERIDAYCRGHELDVPARLRLFLQAVRAVAHAHANLVVHRDLKPSNILVNAQGDVRLLDFGIAKLLDQGVAAETELTQQSGRALTPDYASPEQIRGEAIGTASDVYSLGVVLYELLTGARPYKLERGSRAALEEAILRTEPQRPSAAVADKRLQRALHGDLDTIVQQALKKAAVDRYPTVAALAEDIERHLDQRPVLARPDITLYRLGRLIQRNRLATGAAAAVSVAVLAGSGVSLWQAQQARAEQRRAEQMKDLMGEIFQDVDPGTRAGTAPVSALDLLANARQRMGRDTTLDARSRAELLQIIGQSYVGLGEFKTALALSEQALAVGREALPAEDLRLLRARLTRATAAHMMGQTREARQALAELIATLEDSSGGVAVRQPAIYARAQAQLASFELNEGRQRSELALASAQRAVRVFEAHRLDARLGSFVHQVLATSCGWHDQLELSRDHGKRAYELALEAYGADGRHVRVLEVQNVYGRSLGRLGQLNEAIALLETAAERAAGLYGPKHVMVQHFLGTLGNMQLENGQIKAALANLSRATSSEIGDAKPSASYLASREVVMGRALLAAAQPQSALQRYDKAMALLAEAKPRGTIHWQAEPEHALATALAGDPERAAALLAALLDQLRKGDGGSLQTVLRHQGTAWRLQGQPQQALSALNEALPMLQAAAARPHASVATRVALADALKEVGLAQLDLGQFAAAAARLDQARQTMRAAQAALTPAWAGASLGLARAQALAGDAGAAATLAREVEGFWQDFDAQSPEAAAARAWTSRMQEIKRGGAAAQAPPPPPR